VGSAIVYTGWPMPCCADAASLTLACMLTFPCLAVFAWLPAAPSTLSPPGVRPPRPSCPARNGEWAMVVYDGLDLKMRPCCAAQWDEWMLPGLKPQWICLPAH